MGFREAIADFEERAERVWTWIGCTAMYRHQVADCGGIIFIFSPFDDRTGFISGSDVGARHSLAHPCLARRRFLRSYEPFLWSKTLKKK